MLSADKKAVVTNLLRLGCIDDKILTAIIKSGAEGYEQIFTHSSYEKDHPEEGFGKHDEFKFIGHYHIDLFIANYIKERFPGITEPQWLTKLKHKMQSGRYTADIATKNGFIPLIKYGSSISERYDPTITDEYEQPQFTKMLDSVFRAFCGVTILTANKILGLGTGFVITYNIFKYFFDEIEISLEYSNLWDAKTRYNSLCMQKEWRGCVKNTNIQNAEYELIAIDTKVWGYPLGDTRSIPENRLLLNEKKITNIVNSKAEQQTLVEESLHSLASIFDLRPRALYVKNPYEERVDTTKRVIDPKFQTLIRKVLSQVLSAENVVDFTDYEGMQLYIRAFTHKDIDYRSNYETLEFYGDPYVNAIANPYILKRFPKVINVKWWTRISHILRDTGTLSKMAKNLGFVPFIKYDKSKKKTQLSRDKVYEDVFEAFIGATVVISRKKAGFGSGYAVVYELIGKAMDAIPIRLDYNTLFDARTRLKEMYDGLSWRFTDELSKTFKSGTGAKTVYTNTVYGYLKGNREPKKENMVKLASAEGADEKEVQQIASKKALQVLATKYKIKQDVISAYKK